MEMNARELYDLMALCNKFIEIGLEFSGEEDLQSKS